jgi:hypothetical protein
MATGEKGDLFIARTYLDRALLAPYALLILHLLLDLF